MSATLLSLLFIWYTWKAGTTHGMYKLIHHPAGRSEACMAMKLEKL